MQKMTAEQIRNSHTELQKYTLETISKCITTSECIPLIPLSHHFMHILKLNYCLYVYGMKRQVKTKKEKAEADEVHFRHD